jgi:hypothetical protein
MRTLLARLLRAVSRAPESDYDTPAFTGRAHCNACGCSRWGLMRLSSRGTGLSAFRCDVKGGQSAHITIFTRLRNKYGVVNFRALSRREHFELGAKVRVSQLRNQFPAPLVRQNA